MTRASLSRRPRQTDIARFAGVSVSTVSRVLANEPGISTSVRDQVIRIASELGYNVRPGSRRAAAEPAFGGADSRRSGDRAASASSMRAS